MTTIATAAQPHTIHLHEGQAHHAEAAPDANLIALPLLSDTYHRQWVIQRAAAKFQRGVDIDFTPTHFFDPGAASSAGTGTLRNPFSSAAQVQAAIAGNVQNITLGMRRGSVLYGGLQFYVRGGLNSPFRLVPYGNSEVLPQIVGGVIALGWESLARGVWALRVTQNQDVYQNGFRLLKRSTSYASAAVAIADIATAGPGSIGYCPSAGAVYIVPLDNENPNLGQMEITKAERGLAFGPVNEGSSGNVQVIGIHARLGRDNALGATFSDTQRAVGALWSHCMFGQSGVDQPGGHHSSALLTIAGARPNARLINWAAVDSFFYDGLNNAVEQIHSNHGQVTGNSSWNIGGNSLYEAYASSSNTEIAYNVGRNDPSNNARLCVGSYSNGAFALFGQLEGETPDMNSTANVNNHCHHNLILNARFAFSLGGGANTVIAHNTIINATTWGANLNQVVVRGNPAAPGLTGVSWQFNRNLVQGYGYEGFEYMSLQGGGSPFVNPSSSDYNAYMGDGSWQGGSGARKYVLRDTAGSAASWIGASGLDAHSAALANTDIRAEQAQQYNNWTVVDARYRPMKAHPARSMAAGPNLGYLRDIDGMPLGATPIAGCYA
ncbi:hypothetical protein [Janthinobacterium agaricidamnosum]|uniref:Uncharacterized protein n=1 Tax=Janthinobacterium agaricidamnosum NBRC 102515 = DSM 9628 TaxID=1349767 RepID=W0V8P1_9BURK|nr:hypothetical protein [Janthinobacterium agaricidamnosum]CDG83723.1 hypothetical protein GJA_3097 [Janthinobacterium agaricidamnosum NBRC 102515 = DSM 9628]